MPRDDYEGALLDLHGYRVRSRHTVLLGVRLVKEGHALEVGLSRLHCHCQELIEIRGLPDSGKGFVKEGVHLRVLVPQYLGMIGVGGYALQSEEDQGFEGPYVLVVRPYLLGPECYAAATADVGSAEPLGLLLNGIYLSLDGKRVEVHIGYGPEKSLLYDIVSSAACLPLRPDGQVDEGRYEVILQIRHIRRFPAYPCRARASGTFGRLLALETKHFTLHSSDLLSRVSFGYFV